MTVCLALIVSLALANAPSPVLRAYAYSRATMPGIPPGEGVAASPDRAVSTSYFIYVVLRKGSKPSVDRVWVAGTYYAATLQKVSSPVTVDQNPVVPTGKKDILVPETPGDVYQVCLTDPTKRAPASDAERQLTRDNEVVVFVGANRATWHGTVKTIKRLSPVPGQ